MTRAQHNNNPDSASVTDETGKAPSVDDTVAANGVSCLMM